MVDGLTGNILASLEAASAGVLLFIYFQPSTFCTHWKYVILCLSSGGSSEPVKDMVEKRQEDWEGQLYGSVCSGDGDPLHCSDDSVRLCVCVCVKV